jgi:hypothetical protein
MNLAKKPFRNYTLFYMVFALFAGIVLVLTLYNVVTYLRNSKEYSEYAHLIQSGNNRIRDATDKAARIKDALRMEDRKDLLEYVNFVNESIQLRTFSWTDFFNELENQLPPGVKLFYIRPKGKEEEILILLKFTSKTVKEALEFFDNLDSSPAFESAFPRREARNQTKRNYFDWQISLRYLPEKAGLPAPEEASLAADAETGEGTPVSEDAGFILDTQRLSVTGLPFRPGEESVGLAPDLLMEEETPYEETPADEAPMEAWPLEETVEAEEDTAPGADDIEPFREVD